MTPGERPETGGSYALGRDDEVIEDLRARRLNQHNMFTQHLRFGMRVLDLGCGPGSITFALADLVGPGGVVGIDQDSAIIAKARETLAEEGREAADVRFEVGDAHKLPFPDESFDAVWSQFVFMHLNEPQQAMAEVRRVLRPGGVFGLMDYDLGLFLFEPETELSRQRNELFVRVQQFNGGSMHTAKRYRRMLLNAGFRASQASAFLVSCGTLEETSKAAAGWHVFFSAQLRTAFEQGWIDGSKRDELLQDLLAWGERPDSFGTNGTIIALGFA